MFKNILLYFFFLLSLNSIGQIGFFKSSDTINKKRVIGSSIGIGTVWAGSTIGLSTVWYSNVEKTKWHAFDDSRNWLQMDKAGHAYTANKIAQLTGNLYQWSGVNNTKSAFLGFGVSFGYQTTIEFLDAYSDAWGFSWADVGANFIGSSLYLGQQLGWQEQRIQLKFSYHRTIYPAFRPEVLGSTELERLLKDYNGQTYWITVCPGQFMSDSKIPKWIGFSLGYSANGKLVGDKEVYTSSIPFTPMTFYSSRQYLFSLDIDFSRLPIKRPWLKTIVKQFNYLKIPFPTLILENGKLGARGIYF